MEYGAAIVSLCPFGDVDIVGGFDTLEAYTQDTFNLDGFGGDIKEHTVQIWADSYSEVNDKLIPTGNHPNVIGTML